MMMHEIDRVTDGLRCYALILLLLVGSCVYDIPNNLPTRKLQTDLWWTNYVTLTNDMVEGCFFCVLLKFSSSFIGRYKCRNGYISGNSKFIGQISFRSSIIIVLSSSN